MEKLDKRTYVRYNEIILNKREADMDDKFIKELREISRDDRRRSEFMIQGLKETLQERKEEGILKRWIRRKKTEKKSLKDLIKILTRIKSNNIKRRRNTPPLLFTYLNYLGFVSCDLIHKLAKIHIYASNRSNPSWTWFLISLLT